LSREAHGSPPRRAIVLAGGGARGAYEAGVLRYLLETFPKKTGLEVSFDLVSGTSVGAIHACFLGATAHLDGAERGRRLSEIWENLHVDQVFRFSSGDLLGLPRKLLGLRRMSAQLQKGQRPDRLFGVLDTRPLEQLVRKAIPWRSLRNNLREGRVDAVCVAATQIATGRAVVFVEQADSKLPPWATQTHIRMQAIRMLPVHALASAAIPLLFPAVRIGSRYYADGGLRLATPLAPVVRMGANRILVVALSQETNLDVDEGLAQQRTAGFGNPMYLFGKVLNALLLSPIDADLARMHFINDLIDNGRSAFGDDFLEKLNAEGADKGNRPVEKIHHLVIRPSVDLGMVAGEVMSSGQLELSPFLKLFLKAFGSASGPNESDLLSYLLFDTHYARPLAELGHADAAAQEESLIRFFSDEEMD
jgi:NTE family protein